MIVHLFNSSSYGGPERSVLPLVAEDPALKARTEIWNLVERRRGLAPGSDPLSRAATQVGVTSRTIEVRSRWDLKALSTLGEMLKAHAPTVLHAHDVKATTYAERAKRGLSLKLISTHHGILGRPDLKSRAYEWYYRFGVLRKCDGVIAVSHADRDRLSRSGLRSERLHHLPNAIVLSDSAAVSRTHARELWKLDSEFSSGFCVGWVGRFSEEKDPLRAIDIAAAWMGESRGKSQLKLVMIGEGPLKKQCEARVRAKGLERVVCFPGHRPELRSELQGLDLLCMTSKNEGLPILLLEAGLARIPVIASRVGGVPEVLAAESVPFGELFDPGASAIQVAGRLLAWESQASVRDEWLGRAQRLVDHLRLKHSSAGWRAGLIAIYERS